ncbi:hypothetical protein [Streptomyces sp. NPDC057690]|uniref:hypothetical protein n=1 Tax=Streptomyces sp. NPDC057690 TaxID=3346214 RepID=UPI003685F381
MARRTGDDGRRQRRGRRTAAARGGRRGCGALAAGAQTRFAEDPHGKDLILFHEYFHGDNGAGLGASHQTGWTGLVAATTRLFHTLTADEWHRGGPESLRPKSDGDREEPLS